MFLLDLNHPFTTDDVAMMIASKDDGQHCQVRVSCDGIAYISNEVGNINDGDLAFKLETWLSGNGYVGLEASHDVDHIMRVEAVLRDNWPKPKSSFIDYY